MQETTTGQRTRTDVGQSGESAQRRYLYAAIVGVAVMLFSFLLPPLLFGMNYMFTAHMVQHLLLSLIAPPLILLGLVPTQVNRHIAGMTKGRLFRLLTNPFVASITFNAIIWLWHAPLLMQAMMASTAIHLLADLTYLLSGLLFWWPLVDPLRDWQHALPLAGKLLYLFFSDMPMMLIGAGMTFMAPLYAFDMTDPPMHMVITAQDQQLGGLLMWVAGSIFFIIVASIIFLRWMLRQEREQEQRDLEQDPEFAAEE